MNTINLLHSNFDTPEKMLTATVVVGLEMLLFVVLIYVLRRRG